MSSTPRTTGRQWFDTLLPLLLTLVLEEPRMQQKYAT
jgi:hypothetical protein